MCFCILQGPQRGKRGKGGGGQLCLFSQDNSRTGSVKPKLIFCEDLVVRVLFHTKQTFTGCCSAATEYKGHYLFNLQRRPN